MTCNWSRLLGKLHHYCANNQKTGDAEWELMPFTEPFALQSMVATIERDQATEFTTLRTPPVFSPVHRDGDYSISKSVFGKHSRIFIICDMNFCLAI